MPKWLMVTCESTSAVASSPNALVRRASLAPRVPLHWIYVHTQCVNRSYSYIHAPGIGGDSYHYSPALVLKHGFLNANVRRDILIVNNDLQAFPPTTIRSMTSSRATKRSSMS